MIDKNTGEISIDAVSLKIGPLLKRSDLPTLDVDFKDQVVNEPHHSYSLGEQAIGGVTFYVTLYFFFEELESIELANASAEFGTSWDDWSEASEMKRKAAHDAWLIGQTGNASHKYAWGEVFSDYDVRSGGSSIVMRYSRLGKPWSESR